MKEYNRREHEIYIQGKAAGYIEGYAKGLHDGNPFIALGKVVASLGEIITDPNFIEFAKAVMLEENSQTTRDCEQGGQQNETF